MICSYILTAILAFGIGAYLESISCNKRLENYKKKFLFAMSYLKENKGTDNVLILDFEDEKND